MTQLALASRRYKIQVLTNAMSRSHSSSKLSCLKLSATGSSSTASRQQAEERRQEREREAYLSRRKYLNLQCLRRFSINLYVKIRRYRYIRTCCAAGGEGGKRCQLSMMFSISKGNASIITYLSRFALRNPWGTCSLSPLIDTFLSTIRYFYWQFAVIFIFHYGAA